MGKLFGRYAEGVISRLRGELAGIEGPNVLVDCQGVGYEVTVPDGVLVQLPLIGERVTLLVRQTFREDGQSMFGFLTSDSRRLFDLLLGVSGCGPKSALNLLSLDEQTVARAIVQGDAKTLTRASGVGPKLAQKIIIDLKDKVGDIVSRGSVSRAPVVVQEDDDLMAALLALGFRRAEAEPAAEQARSEAKDIPGQIRIATALMRPK